MQQKVKNVSEVDSDEILVREDVNAVVTGEEEACGNDNSEDKLLNIVDKSPERLACGKSPKPHKQNRKARDKEAYQWILNQSCASSDTNTPVEMYNCVNNAEINVDDWNRDLLLNEQAQPIGNTEGMMPPNQVPWILGSVKKRRKKR